MGSIITKCVNTFLHPDSPSVYTSANEKIKAAFQEGSLEEVLSKLNEVSDYLEPMNLPIELKNDLVARLQWAIELSKACELLTNHVPQSSLKTEVDLQEFFPEDPDLKEEDEPFYLGRVLFFLENSLSTIDQETEVIESLAREEKYEEMQTVLNRLISLSMNYQKICSPQSRGMEEAEIFFLFSNFYLMLAHCLTMTGKFEEAKSTLDAFLAVPFESEDPEVTVQSDRLKFYNGLLKISLGQEMDSNDELAIKNHLEFTLLTTALLTKLDLPFSPEVEPKNFKIVSKFAEYLHLLTPVENKTLVEKLFKISAENASDIKVEDLIESLKFPSYSTLQEFCLGDFEDAKKSALDSLDIWTLLCLKILEAKA